MVTLGFKSFTRRSKPHLWNESGLWNENMNHFNALRGPCLVWRNQKYGKYLVSGVKYDRGMYTFLTNYENEYL